MPLSFRRRVGRLVGTALLAWPALAAPLAAQPFTFSFLPQDLPAVYAGTAAWADIDNDGDLDVFVAGRTGDGLVAAVYRNDSPRGRHAAPVFVRAATLDPVAYLSADWGDYDRDGDLDLVVAGSATGGVPYAAVTRLYRNDGGAFTDVGADLEGLHSGSADWGDLDNDGDLDLLITGTAAADLPYTPATHRYRNDGGTFTRVPTDLPDVTFGDAAWGDYDGDGDLDLVLVGYGGARGFIGEVFRNDGGVFSAVGAGLPGLAFSTVDWGDYDGDGDLDLTLSGGRSSAFLLDGEAHVFRNDGGAFQRADFGLDGVLSGEAGWGDYDGDGDLDLLVLGAVRPLDRYAARVYENQGGAAFREQVLLVGAIFADAAWGDYDGDGDLDLLTAGLAQSTIGSGPMHVPVTNLYRNDRVPLDAPPAPPAGLRADVAGAAVALAWTPPADERPVSKGLTYALRVGTTPGASDVLAAAADPATGTRRVTTSGEASVPAWTLRGLVPGTYYWGVQSVSAAFAGSAFVEGGAFTVDAAPGTTTDAEAAALPTAFAVTGVFPNPFAEAVHIAYALPASSAVTFRVFNLLGETVRTVHHEAAAGAHDLVWDGRDAAGQPVPSGLYVYELRTAHGAQSGRVVRVR